MKTKQTGRIAHEQRIFLYELFWRYYRGELMALRSDDWKTIANFISSTQVPALNESVNEGIKLLANISEEDVSTFEFDYNRLFIGPNELLASPFESSYLNYEGMPMEEETMRVRRFYYREGFQLAHEGQIPDDHLQFELEFIYLMISSPGFEEKQAVSMAFIEKHLLQWCEKHCEKIMDNSQNQITLAMSYLFKGFLQMEKMLIESGDRDVN